MKALLRLFFLLLFIACEKIDLDQLQETDDNNSQTGDTQLSEACPQPCTLYNNKHVIVFSDPLPNDSVALTLISLQEWNDLPSANNTDSPDEALQIAAEYSEPSNPLNTSETAETFAPNILASWHIPTSSEARRLRTTYGSETLEQTSVQGGITIMVSNPERTTPTLTQLNTLLSLQRADKITLTQGTNNARYLCDDGQRSFSFVSGTSITTAGSKASHYRLRLLKTIRIKVSP